MKVSKFALREVGAKENSAKGKDKTKPHLESSLSEKDIKNWLEQWKGYEDCIYVYPYGKDSIDKNSNLYFENWIQLSFNPEVFFGFINNYIDT